MSLGSSVNGPFVRRRRRAPLAFALLLAGWWPAPQDTLALPPAVQRVAAATQAGWMRLYTQFDISVGALQMMETHCDALLAAAAGAAAVTLDCGIATPGTAAGRLVLRWLDRNASAPRQPSWPSRSPIPPTSTASSPT